MCSAKCGTWLRLRLGTVSDASGEFYPTNYFRLATNWRQRRGRRTFFSDINLFFLKDCTEHSNIMNCPRTMWVDQDVTGQGERQAEASCLLSSSRDYINPINHIVATTSEYPTLSSLETTLMKYITQCDHVLLSGFFLAECETSRSQLLVAQTLISPPQTTLM